jgi:ferritin-like metal-binding protein YciE
LVPALSLWDELAVLATAEEIVGVVGFERLETNMGHSIESAEALIGSWRARGPIVDEGQQVHGIDPEIAHDTLKDIFYAEKKILTALPKMAKAAQNEDLKAAFEKHEGETEEQVARLERVFEAIEKKPQGKKCPAIDGIIEEGQEIIKEYKGSPALDSGLLAAAQAVEHYEISRYGTLRTWAQELGLSQAAGLLETTLNEEKATDEALTELAEVCVNQEAQAEAAE